MVTPIDRYGSQSVTTHHDFPSTFNDNDRKKLESLRAQAERYTDTIAPAPAAPEVQVSATKKSNESTEIENSASPSFLTQAYNYLISFFTGSSSNTVQEESGASLLSSPYSGVPRLDSPVERKTDLARLERLATFMKEMQQALEAIQQVAKEELVTDTAAHDANGHFAFLQLLKKYDKNKQDASLRNTEEIAFRYQLIQDAQKKQNTLTIQLEDAKFYSNISDKIKSGSEALLAISAVFQVASWIGAGTGQLELALPAKLIALSLTGINSGSKLVSARLDNSRIETKGQITLIQHAQDAQRQQIKDLSQASKQAESRKTNGIRSAAEAIRRFHELIQQVSNV